MCGCMCVVCSSSMYEIPVILPKVQVAGYSETLMHPTYMALNEVKL